MVTTIIKTINLGGIDFTASKKLKKHKLYNLSLKADLQGKEIETGLKIILVGTSKKDGECVYRAFYRHLTDVQINAIKEISENFSNGNIKNLTGILSKDKGNTKMNEITIKFASQMHYDNLLTLSAEYNLSVESLLDIAVERLIADVEFVRDLRTMEKENAQ